MQELVRAPEGAGAALVDFAKVPAAPAMTAERRRLQAQFEGVHAYVALYLDLATSATVQRPLTALYGKSKASTTDIGKLALVELGVLGPERYEFLCALAIGQDTLEDPDSEGFKIVLKQHTFLRMVNKQQFVDAYKPWHPSADVRIEAERKTKRGLAALSKYVAVFLDEETLDVWSALLPVQAEGEYDIAPLQRACLFALGQYDVTKTMLLAALKVGKDAKEGVEVRLWHEALSD